LGDTVGDNVLFDPWLTSYVGISNNPLNTHPAEFRLHSAFPNPFNPATSISYQLSADSYVSLKVYDTAGRLVTTLMDGWRGAGEHRAVFDGLRMSSGIYLVRLEAGGYSQVRKMAMLK
jgi:hypothetical protein